MGWACLTTERVALLPLMPIAALGCFKDSSRSKCADCNSLCSQATMFAGGFVEGLKGWKQQQAVVLSACEPQTAGKASHSADLSEVTDLSGDHTLSCKSPHEAGIPTTKNGL